MDMSGKNVIMQKIDKVLALRCPLCNENLTTPDSSEDGDVIVVQCVCGFVSRAIVEKHRREVFEWCFDNGARSVFWDVTALKEELVKIVESGNRLIQHTLSTELVDHLWLENPQNTDIAEDRPTESWSEPILLIPHLSVFADQFPFPFLPIDGWHRIHRAYNERRELVATFLPTEFELRHRVVDMIHVGWNGSAVDAVFDPSGKMLCETFEEIAEQKTMLSMKR